jgi:hypothetical protein
MKRKIRLTESDLTRLIKRVISEQTTKDVTVKVDCTKKTVNGFTGIADGFFTPHCATAQAGTTTQAGTKTKSNELPGMPDFNITLDQMKAVGVNTLPYNRESTYGDVIMGPGQNEFQCFNSYWEYTYKWQTKDPGTTDAVRAALKPIYMKQCQTNLAWRQKAKQLGKL